MTKKLYQKFVIDNGYIRRTSEHTGYIKLEAGQDLIWRTVDLDYCNIHVDLDEEDTIRGFRIDAGFSKLFTNALNEPDEKCRCVSFEITVADLIHRAEKLLERLEAPESLTPEFRTSWYKKFLTFEQEMNEDYFSTSQAREARVIGSMGDPEEALIAANKLAANRASAAESLGIFKKVEQIVKQHGIQHSSTSELELGLPPTEDYPGVDCGYDPSTGELWVWQSRTVLDWTAERKKIIPGVWLKRLLSLNSNSHEVLTQLRETQIKIQLKDALYDI